MPKNIQSYSTKLSKMAQNMFGIFTVVECQKIKSKVDIDIKKTNIYIYFLKICIFSLILHDISQEI